jgi:proline iminopeptidase
MNSATLEVSRFVDDIEALREQLGEEKLSLVGHSWGANLALLYGVAHPERVERIALVGMGPISDEMDAVAGANLLKPLQDWERVERARLREELARAIDQPAAAVRGLHNRLAELTTRAWFASAQCAEQFLLTYLKDEPSDRQVNRAVMQSYRSARVGLPLGRIRAPVLIVYGYQDFEPITQAYLLREQLPRAQLCLLNECGHLPWLEQPELFYTALTGFLSA